MQVTSDLHPVSVSKLRSLISPPRNLPNSSVDISDFLPRKWANSSDLSFDSSEVSFDSSEEFFISYLGIGKFLGRNSILREKGVIREVP